MVGVCCGYLLGSGPPALACVIVIGLSEHVADTEQGESYGTMIFDGICYSARHFGRVILYVWSSHFVVSLS